MYIIEGNIVDVVHKKIYPGRIHVSNGYIRNIVPGKVNLDQYIMPGFVDAHVHIESSMLTPEAFGALAIKHGTVGVVADPHEITNVLGTEGFRYMLDDAGNAVIKIRYGVPSCVPATPLETSGADINAKTIESLFQEDKRFHLAEMMNFPGVIVGDDDVMEKISVARRYGRVIDGHAPGLRGEELKKYAEAGISTDHECAEIGEAMEKIKLGMHILIREGSAAKNFEALIPLMNEYPEKLMFCTDDAHPDELSVRHIKQMVIRALEKGYDFWSVLRSTTLNPVRFYNLDMGLLQEGDPADFLVCDDLKNMKIHGVYVNGNRVYDGDNAVRNSGKSGVINNFRAGRITKEDINVHYRDGRRIRVIQAQDGSLYTKSLVIEPKHNKGHVVQDIEKDVLKIVVVNRYRNAPPAVAFIHGFGIKRGALASSIAHDSHNLVAVGTDDEYIVKVLNRVIDAKGGIAFTGGDTIELLPLPVAGLMTTEPGEKVAIQYARLNKLAQDAGSGLHAPFMTLSFMSLLVIPELKIGDKGLFDVNSFGFTDLWE